MLDNKQRLREQSMSDIIRIVLGFVLMTICFFPWVENVNGLEELGSSFRMVKFVAGFGIAVALITHVTRRLLFPYVDLKEYAIQAKKEPIAAAIVFFGMCIIIATTIGVSAGFFK